MNDNWREYNIFSWIFVYKYHFYYQCERKDPIITRILLKGRVPGLQWSSDCLNGMNFMKGIKKHVFFWKWLRKVCFQSKTICKDLSTIPSECILYLLSRKYSSKFGSRLPTQQSRKISLILWKSEPLFQSGKDNRPEQHS